MLVEFSDERRPGFPPASLRRVWVYRGLPSSEYDSADNARSLAQQHHWERDPRVHVTLRPLRYRVERDAAGRPIRDVNGKVTIIEKREKGVDILCALALVREAARDDVDLVILASHDSDLEPAIEEARELGSAKIEAFRWDSPDAFAYQLRSSDRTRPVWCTKLDEVAFRASRDLTPYRSLMPRQPGEAMRARSKRRVSSHQPGTGAALRHIVWVKDRDVSHDASGEAHL